MTTKEHEELKRLAFRYAAGRATAKEIEKFHRLKKKDELELRDPKRRRISA